MPAMRQLDGIDERLLALLQRNARLPAAALARQLGLSRSAVQERLHRLERDGVIQGYTPVLAGRHALAPFQAHVMIMVDPKLHDRSIDSLRGLPAVTRCHTVSGTYDLVAELAAGSGEELDAVLTRIGKLPGVERTLTSILLTCKFDRGRGG